MKTATEVISDNSALMRNIARHEHVLEQSITGIARALLHIARGFGVDLPHEGDLKVLFDDSIITDTFQEKKQDLAEVGVTMAVVEFRQKWYGENKAASKEHAKELANAVTSERFKMIPEGGEPFKSPPPSNKADR